METLFVELFLRTKSKKSGHFEGSSQLYWYLHISTLIKYSYFLMLQECEKCIGLQQLTLLK